MKESKKIVEVPEEGDEVEGEELDYVGENWCTEAEEVEPENLNYNVLEEESMESEADSG